MSKDGYYGDFESAEDEIRAYHEFNRFRNEQEPNCVPCFNCGEPMYEVASDPRENLCESCISKKYPRTIKENPDE